MTMDARLQAKGTEERGELQSEKCKMQNDEEELRNEFDSERRLNTRDSRRVKLAIGDSIVFGEVNRKEMGCHWKYKP